MLWYLLLLTIVGTTNTASLTPISPLAFAETYTARVLGGAGGVTDAAGNEMDADYSWTFTTAAAGTPGNYSLWNDTIIPQNPSDSDTSAVELGVKFQSEVDGYITGLRFYKSDQNTGTHLGNFWTADGTLLSSVNFTNETAFGWQEVVLPAPLPISADTTYVASYHTAVGHYSADSGYFDSAYVNSPLSALADGESANGVFRYGDTGFPDQSWQATNYWVDVVFQASILPGDFDGDCDVDGADAAQMAGDITKMPLSTFAQNFGIAACP